MAPTTPRRAFNLSRWFGSIGLVSIAALALTCAVLLSRLFTERMLQQDATLTMHFVQSIIDVEKASTLIEQFGTGRQAPKSAKLDELLEHLAALPGILRANVYSTERRLLWSSDKSLAVREQADNDELDAALAGKLQVQVGNVLDNETFKPEHVHLKESGNYFIEIYLPIRDASGERIVGVVELYRAPRRLFEAIRAGERIIWIGALVAGSLLYLALFSLIRRADILIRHQQERLVEAETLAAVGEMGSAVAHGIRNPLAVIRSSAELALGAGAATADEAAKHIMAQVDQLEQWVRELLTYTRPFTGSAEPIDLGVLVTDNMAHFARELDRRGIRNVVALPAGLPAVRGDMLLLGQVVHSLIANAIEAMQQGGELTIRGEAKPEERRVELRIEDSGPGMSPAQIENAFKLFHTTKPHGLGVGLPLAKRIVERLGGEIAVLSRPGSGTRVAVQLPAA